MPPPLGVRFAEALAAKRFDDLAELLHPEIDFAALTPRRHWVAGSPEEVIGDVLRSWFDDEDEIRELVALDTGAFTDRERVGYRFRVTNPDGDFVVEQQAYLEERDGRIGWMRVVCSGFRPDR